MDKFIIEGGTQLRGTVTPSGNKNAALPMIAACLLTDEPVTLRNVPRIRDVEDMLALLANIGVTIHEVDAHTLVLHARQVRTTELDRDICSRIRASILFAGPMLARMGQIHLPPPGGDVIGRRRVDTHIHALRALGAEIRINDGFDFSTEGLRGKDIFLDEASVTGTENALMAAVLAKGTTIIRNAACEPHVQDLARLLNAMGARISGIGTNTLTIEGVGANHDSPLLHGAEFEIGPDYIETGSFIGLAAVTRGEILIKNAAPEHLRMVLLTFARLGVECQVRGNDVYVSPYQSLRVQNDLHDAIPTIADGIWPQFPSDLMSIALVTATQCEGTVLMWEKMFEGRMFWVDKLISMGGRVILCDPHRAVVVGPSHLHGERLESPDIRAGMALLLAALCARGQSIIGNIGQIDRGYERIEEKLQALGARIERVRQ
ncbi:MAG: UDP-N-acetylglucosamine 1-carboxyvinyltransferase [Anaerolineae bacterium]|nr:UDP-N-acetylglucosamine 1-carboxyvinyltransferase [Anaerolineae bacterium]